MNIRSLTRGDGAVIGAAVLLLITSFLNVYASPDSCTADYCEANYWSQGLVSTLAMVHLLGLAVAGLFVASRTLPEGRKLVGIGFAQWATVLSVVVGWSAVWAALPPLFSGLSLGAGAWTMFIFGLALAAAGVLNSTLPALKAPLLPATGPKQPNMYGAQQGGYGYPGAQPMPGQPGQPMPGQQGPYGAQPQGGYGYPGGQPMPGQAGQPMPGQQGGQPQPQPVQGGQPQPQPQPQPGGRPGQPQSGQQPQAGGAAAAGAPDPNFQPFWFAVPVPRPLFAEDGSPQPVAELAPGTWYLAVEQRGQVLIAQTQDGRRGVLQDTSGIQRG